MKLLIASRVKLKIALINQKNSLMFYEKLFIKECQLKYHLDISTGASLHVFLLHVACVRADAYARVECVLPDHRCQNPAVFLHRW